MELEGLRSDPSKDPVMASMRTSLMVAASSFSLPETKERMWPSPSRTLARLHGAWECPSS
eukprot:7086920-Pyramimonas_sp.AAC.2